MVKLYSALKFILKGKEIVKKLLKSVIVSFPHIEFAYHINEWGCILSNTVYYVNLFIELKRRVKHLTTGTGLLRADMRDLRKCLRESVIRIGIFRPALV